MKTNTYYVCSEATADSQFRVSIRPYHLNTEYDELSMTAATHREAVNAAVTQLTGQIVREILSMTRPGDSCPSYYVTTSGK